MATGEPGLIEAFDVVGRTERVMDGWVNVVDVATVGSVDVLGGPEAWREESQVDGVVSAFGGVGAIVGTDNVGAMVGGAKNFERATLLVAEFGDASMLGRALNGDAGLDKIADLKETLVNGAVGAGTVVFATVQSENLEDFGGESGVGLPEAEVVMNGRKFTKYGDGRCGERKVERKGKSATDGGDTAWDVGAIDGAGVPSVGSGVGGASENGGRFDATVGRLNGDGFVEDAEEAFDREGLVIAGSDGVKTDFENRTHVLEEAFEFAIVVDNDEAAEADAKENGLHEEIGERRGCGSGEVIANNKTSEVAHGGEEMGRGAHPAVFLGDAAGFPEIDVKNVEGRADGPREMKFTVVTSGFEGGVALAASAAGRVDVGGHAGPEKALPDLVKGFVAAEVTASGARVINIEEQVA